jgi:hypothetical protein
MQKAKTSHRLCVYSATVTAVLKSFKKLKMRHDSLSAELDAITGEFDYGIVPGSATVFVKDEINGIGRLDLTLLEGVMIVLEVTDRGYRVEHLNNYLALLLYSLFFQ